MPSQLVALGAAGILSLWSWCGRADTLLAAGAEAQRPAQKSLRTVKRLACAFPLLANGTWSKGEPHADVKAATLSMRFDDINTDEGTATVSDKFGRFEITARLSTDTLHFVQSFTAGPLYVTTVFNSESRNGKLKAVHARHEFTEAVLPGFTSSPEQYYGECEVDP